MDERALFLEFSPEPARPFRRAGFFLGMDIPHQMVPGFRFLLPVSALPLSFSLWITGLTETPQIVNL
jgi:hypothetical protein